MRALRYWRGGLSAAAVALTAGLALAAPDPTFSSCAKTPTPEDTEGAKGAVKGGVHFEDLGDYDRAIQYFKDAYNLDCTVPKLIIMVGRVQEKKGDRASAISTYEAYLQRAPNSPEASTIAEKVKNLKAALQPPPPAASAAPSVGPAASAAPAASGSPVAPPAGEGGERPYGILPLAVAGGGVALAIVGGVLLGVGSGKVSTAEKTCPNHACPPGTPDSVKAGGNSGRTLETVGVPFLLVGILAAGGGLGWQFLGNKPKADAPKTGGLDRTIAVHPAVGPGLTGFSVSGAF